MKILLLFGHPAYHNSTVNRELLKGINNMENVTFHNLYEAYPELDIDIDREQVLLTNHDCIIFMYPLFWYSTPTIFREWQDLVLEHGWAFGSKGNALKGKWFFSVVSTGASREMYQKGQMQNYTLIEFLYPLTQMAKLCSMISLPPFVTHGSHNMDPESLDKHHQEFQRVLKTIAEDRLDVESVMNYEYMNDYINKKN